MREGPFEEIYIQPAAGDSGAALGAALYAYHIVFGHARALIMEDADWGASYEPGEIRRFLTGPRGCEITGVHGTPDGRSLFVSIQHPGEPASGDNNPANRGAISTWPDGPGIGVPRSATIVIRRSAGSVAEA